MDDLDSKRKQAAQLRFEVHNSYQEGEELDNRREMAIQNQISVPRIDIPRYEAPWKTTARTDVDGTSYLRINPLSPVTVADGKVTVNSDSMVLDKCYSFDYNGQPYLAIRTSDTVIDIYRVVE